MRNELADIQQIISATSRCHFIFNKSKVSNAIGIKLAQIEDNLQSLETALSDTENSLATTQVTLSQTKTKLSETENALASTSDKLNDTEEKLAKTENSLAATQATLNQTKTKLSETETTLADTKDKLSDTEDKLAKTETSLSTTQVTLKQTESKLSDTENTLITTNNKLSQTEEKLSETKTSLEVTKETLKDTASMLSATEMKLTKSQRALNETQEKLETEKAYAQSLNHQLSEQVLKNTIISQLLSAEAEHIGVTEFRRVLHEEFLPFANEEATLVNEAEAFLKLQKVEKELQVIGAHPSFHNKNTIAVAGGFSAGKSEFISSLFTDKTMKLPSGVLPTTAIPIYAMAGNKNALLGCSYLGGLVDLLKIEPAIQEKLSHDFIGEFGFNLKNIMPYMFLVTPMPYEHICFIDTPGYNPAKASNSYTSEDFETAGNFVSNADSLIWVVSIGAGTLPKSDLDFLQQFADGKHVYVVLNKADLRSKSDIEDVLDTVQDMLEDYDIDYQGISAYSSIQGKEINFRKMRLAEFLTTYNKKSTYHEQIIDNVREVALMYLSSLKIAIQRNSKRKDELEDFRKQLAQEDVDDFNQYEELIMTLKAELETDKHYQEIQQLHIIMDNLMSAVDMVFGAVSEHKLSA